MPYSKKKKQNRQEAVGEFWIFCGIVRGKPSECFIEVVENKSRDELLEVIKRRTKPGTIICSDGWKSYKSLTELLPEMGFKEYRVAKH